MDNVKCLLEPGDKVMVNELWGGKIGGKEATIISVRWLHGNYRHIQ